MTGAPWSFEQARAACRDATKAQENAEQTLIAAARAFGEAEQAYRVALAKRIVELRADGMAWSVCEHVARGDEKVAHLKAMCALADGVREAAVHGAWRRAADRRDVQRFVDYSFRREFAEAGPGVEMPQWSREAA